MEKSSFYHIYVTFISYLYLLSVSLHTITYIARKIVGQIHSFGTWTMDIMIISHNNVNKTLIYLSTHWQTNSLILNKETHTCNMLIHNYNTLT